MPSRFLNNQWRFCHVWHNSENRFEFESCWIWARAQILNGPIRRWNDLASGRCRGTHYKSLGKAEEVNFKANFCVLCESFDRRNTHIWSEIYWALWNYWFYCDLGLFFLRRKRFVEWRLVSDGWSGFPANRSLSRRGKNERFAVSRRETRKRIASFKEAKYDFSL